MGSILGRVLRLCQGGQSAALAVVTKIEGSGYRRPGAKLLIEPEGGVVGGVSGGCIEEDVRQVGLQVIASGEPRVLRYDTSDDESKLWGLGLGCDGKVDVFVHRIAPESSPVWEKIRELVEGSSAFAVATSVDEGAPVRVLVIDASGKVAGDLGDAALEAEIAAAARSALAAGRSALGVFGGRAVFTDVLAPPPKLVVCGGGDDAAPLVRFAAAVGFRVFVADHRPAHLTSERFPDAARLVLVRPEEERGELPRDATTYVVVKTHSLRNDTAWVRRYVDSAAPYIGVLGPKKRVGKILAEIGAEANGRVYGPVGLDIGADGPEQVGLSIVAELLAAASGRSPRHLRERQEPLHVG